MLTKKEQKALELLRRMKGSDNFFNYIHDAILLKRVELMGVGVYDLMHKFSREESLRQLREKYNQ